MSLYRKAWLFTGWTLLVFLTSPIWFFAPVERWGMAAALPGMIFWFAHGAVMVWVLKCPDCGCSLYLISKRLPGFYAPWPKRKCSCCGFDMGT
ncbi:MAG: hypothetical protein M3Q08_11580 [Pseudomonadota bacterium]|nr:hypothetical protein [Pseudomonadota bacterium]